MIVKLNNKHMESNISLTIVERQILVNQLRILKQFESSNEVKKDYDNQIEALESGYELHYQDAFENISEDVLTADECREVLEVLEMFRGIMYSYKALERENNVKELKLSKIAFAGFAGNYETKQMFYVRYFINQLDRYGEIQETANFSDNFNSHRQMLSIYREMLRLWTQYRHTLSNPYLMTVEEIMQLTRCYCH